MNESSRDKTYRSMAITVPSELTAKATERTGYRMPLGYTSSKVLINIDIVCEITAKTSTDEITLYSIANKRNEENVAFSVAFAKHFNRWTKDKGCLYCIKEELATALLKTDIVNKKGILKDLPVALPRFLVAIPQTLIKSPGAENDCIDFLLISCSTNENEDKTIFVSSMTTNANLLVLTLKIAKGGEIVDKEDIGNNEFCNKILFFVLNILLLLGTARNSFVSDVLPSQTINKQATTKGFNKKVPQLLPKYPRWIGESYQIKTERLSNSDSPGTHASPRTHWRRGHWRCIEPGEGKQWKESKRLWIEPILINAGID